MEESGVKTKENKRFQAALIIILMIFAVLAIVPFLILLASSFTEESTLIKYGYSLLPRKFSAYAYYYLFQSNGAKVLRSYGITFAVTIIGTVISLLIGPMLGWVLSRKDYPHRKLLTFMVFFTMLFNGGIVPSYIMYTQLFHLKNSFWALIFPTLIVNGFYIMLYKNNFASNIHPALVEAAKIDGAGELYIYFKVVLPLSKPILATVGLMVGLGYWNDWTNGLYYITDTDLYSLQQLLKSIIDNINNLNALASSADVASVVSKMPGTSIRMAMAVIGVIPIMVLYPFFQKAFIAGIALGGVKE